MLDPLSVVDGMVPAMNRQRSSVRVRRARNRVHLGRTWSVGREWAEADIVVGTTLFFSIE